MSAAKASPPLLRLAAGLLIALLLAVGLITWLGSQARRALADSSARQAALIDLAALVGDFLLGSAVDLRGGFHRDDAVGLRFGGNGGQGPVSRANPDQNGRERFRREHFEPR